MTISVFFHQVNDCNGKPVALAFDCAEVSSCHVDLCNLSKVMAGAMEATAKRILDHFTLDGKVITDKE